LTLRIDGIGNARNLDVPSRFDRVNAERLRPRLEMLAARGGKRYPPHPPVLVPKRDDFSGHGLTLRGRVISLIRDDSQLFAKFNRGTLPQPYPLSMPEAK
jgi:hypothetical protein